MDRSIMWTPWEGPGQEHLHLSDNESGVIADSWIIVPIDEKIYRVHYNILCDTDWSMRQITLELSGESNLLLKLNSDGAGHWTDVSGKALPELDGCLDVDISVTPFTNTLPIRRLKWNVGASAELTMVYFKVPELQFRPMRQRYTCLEKGPDGGLFRYDSVVSGFTAQLPIDKDGLVLDYPGLARRVWPE